MKQAISIRLDRDVLAYFRKAGAGWQARKAKMKQRVRDMAGELIRTAAERRTREATL